MRPAVLPASARALADLAGCSKADNSPRPMAAAMPDAGSRTGAKVAPLHASSWPATTLSDARPVRPNSAALAATPGANTQP